MKPPLISPRLIPNRWDTVAFFLLFGVIALFIEGMHQMHAPLITLQIDPLSLDPHNLPEYSLRTILRMLAAMFAALIFTFIYATLAAKSRRAEMILIPLLDILQSVPVLGFISFTVVFFLRLFPGNILGAELAAIFAIFTSQAWNMTSSFYQSLKEVPRDLEEVSRAFRFSAWQKFWRLEVPFAMPGLVWNMMISMSGGWFFVVASEAITVGSNTFSLPGIGSYVALAIAERDMHAIFYAITAMFLVILVYDQLLFRPLVEWSSKFQMEKAVLESERSWVLWLLKRTRLLKKIFYPLHILLRWFQNLYVPLPRVLFRTDRYSNSAFLNFLWPALIIIAAAYGGWRLFYYLETTLILADLGEALKVGSFTLLRVIVLVILASLIWVPVGVWIGLKPRLASRVQPLAQFLAAFPANLLFPIAVMGIVQLDLNPNIWLSPLMILGAQWYILFNVIAGAAVLPHDLKEVSAAFHIRGWQWWKTVILPAILPYYVTGAITATGGAWNASILAELVSWGDTTLVAQGLGSYIAKATVAADYPRIILGIAVMCFFVIALNRIVWRNLDLFTARRLKFP